MHEYAQKSTTTTLPRRLSRVSGCAVEPAGGAHRAAAAAPSVFDGPLAPCADIIAPPSGGRFSAAAIIMAPLPASAAGAALARRLRARALRRAHRHRLRDVQRRQHALEVAHLRQIVDDDVRIRRVIEQVVLVVALGFVESACNGSTRVTMRSRIHAGLVELRDVGFGDLLLRVVGVEDGRAILRAGVRTLAVQLRRDRAPPRRTPAGSARR